MDLDSECYDDDSALIMKNKRQRSCEEEQTQIERRVEAYVMYRARCGGPVYYNYYNNQVPQVPRTIVFDAKQGYAEVSSIRLLPITLEGLKSAVREL